MSNPFVIAMRSNPAQFLSGLETAEVRAVCEGCIALLAERARSGDRTAAPAIQALYRSVAEIEI
ncbi:MAG: hypothetical protein WD270_02465 [Acetobacterales bacterium]